MRSYCPYPCLSTLVDKLPFKQPHIVYYDLRQLWQFEDMLVTRFGTSLSEQYNTSNLLSGQDYSTN